MNESIAHIKLDKTKKRKSIVVALSVVVYAAVLILLLKMITDINVSF